MDKYEAMYLSEADERAVHAPDFSDFEFFVLDTLATLREKEASNRMVFTMLLGVVAQVPGAVEAYEERLYTLPAIEGPGNQFREEVVGLIAAAKAMRRGFV